MRGIVPRLEQVLRPAQVGLRLGELRLETGDLRIERLHLQGELLVADGGDDLAALDRSPSLTVSSATVPPMRARAGTTRGLSTVANTAFSSETVRGRTMKTLAGRRRLDQRDGSASISAMAAARIAMSLLLDAAGPTSHIAGVRDH